MSVLLVDIGNTRVKWMMLRAGRIGARHAREHGGRTATLGQLVKSAPRDVERVVAVCVAGARMERALSAAVRTRFGIRVEFARSTREECGVRNAYRDTWRLGADRWVSLFAAHALGGSRPVLVANIGTALTLDALAPDGRHLGGAIAPGPSTMIASLLQGTQGIRRRARGAKKTARPVRRLFVADTASALEAGASYAVAGLIERAVAEARRSFGRSPLLLLTGGGAARLHTYIRVPATVVPDLVLRGLALLAESRI